MSPTPRLLLPRTTPEEAGVDPAGIADLVRALDAGGGTHSLMIVRQGRVIAEHWWHPHAADQPHQMYSVSKTVTAMAVGLAVHEGLLALDDRVVDLLPDDVPADPSANLRAMTLRHLLTMSAGFEIDTMNAIVDDDMHWARTILAVPVVREPGTRFLYDTGVTYLLSAILHRATGARLLDWLTPRLFAPLGIDGITWQQSSQGIDTGGFGLTLTTEHMAAFGQLLLQNGRWGDAQLIPAEWIADATARHSDPSVMGWGIESTVGYGYQLWHCTSGAYRADGAFGQFVVVWPQHDAVVAITSGLPFETQNDQLALTWEHLAPAFDRAPRGDAEPIGALRLPVPRGAARGTVEGGSFAYDGGTVALTRQGDLLDLELEGLRVVAAHDAWHENAARVPIDGQWHPLHGSYAWTAERTLEVRGVTAGTPYARTATLTFSPDGQTVEVAVDQNASFGSKELLRTTAVSTADAAAVRA